MPLNIPNLEKNKILAPFTSYKIGGQADLFVAVRTATDLINAVLEARRNRIPVFLLGCGSNILVTDKGFRGLVVHNLTSRVQFIGNGTIVAESGVIITDLIEQCLQRGLSGLEHFAGIPGTVGGAMWQNLHFLSPDRQRTILIGKVVKAGCILSAEGDISPVDVGYFEFGYDTSILQQRSDVVLDVTFQLIQKPKEEIQAVISSNLAWRNDKQPPLAEYPSCGSVFKKIKDIGAGRLIDQAGLKGMRIGGAEVSKKHANFIVNTGNARADDVIQLILHIQSEVKRKLGYNLETEINIIGER